MSYKEARNLITVRKDSSGDAVSYIAWCGYCDPPTKKEVFVNRLGDNDAIEGVYGQMIAHWRREHKLTVEKPPKEN